MGYGRIDTSRALTETVAPPTLTIATETFPNGQRMKLTACFDKVLDPEQGEVVIQGPPKEVRLGTNFHKLPKGPSSYRLRGKAPGACPQPRQQSPASSRAIGRPRKARLSRMHRARRKGKRAPPS